MLYEPRKGRCQRRRINVLILVLMEYALRVLNRISYQSFAGVLILVLMEYALRVWMLHEEGTGGTS